MRILPACIGLLVAGACIPDVPAEDGAVTAERLRDRAFRLDAETGLALIEATESTLRVATSAHAPALRPGDVLILETEIRRVVAIEGTGELAITTESAGLADAFVELDLSAAYRGSTIEANARADSAEFRWALGNLRFAVGGGSIAIENGTLRAVPDVELSMSLAKRTFQLDYSLRVTGDFDVRFKVNGPAAIGSEHKVPGLSRDFVVWAGAIPVVVTVDVVVGWTADLDGVVDIAFPVHIDEYVKGRVEHRAGTGWQAQLWSSTTNSRGGAIAHNRTVAHDFELRAFVKPRVTVAPFKVAGPQLSIEPNVFVRHDNLPGDSHGVRAGIAVRGNVNLVVNLFEALGQQVGVRYRLWELFDKDVWAVVHRTPLGSCRTYTGPSFGDLACNVAGLKNHANAVTSCVQGGGGKSCFTSAQPYGETLCGLSSFVKRCNIERAFACICYGGGAACFDPAEGVCW